MQFQTSDQVSESEGIPAPLDGKDNGVASRNRCKSRQNHEHLNNNVIIYELSLNRSLFAAIKRQISEGILEYNDVMNVAKHYGTLKQAKRKNALWKGLVKLNAVVYGVSIVY